MTALSQSAGLHRKDVASHCFCALGAFSTVINVTHTRFNRLDPPAIFNLRVALRNTVEGGSTLVTALHDLGTPTSICDAG